MYIDLHIRGISIKFDIKKYQSLSFFGLLALTLIFSSQLLKEEFVLQCGQLWKMCQIFKFKQCNKLKMSYIQAFLQQNLVQFYLSTLKTHLDDPSFLDFTANGNIFSLTADLLLFAQRGCGEKLKDSLHGLISRQMLISYECLRNYRLPVCQSDGEVIRLMKDKIKEVYIQLLQLLLRFILCYIESANSQFLNNTILTHISEISFIYPQVKTEISINFPEISLPAFLQTFITSIAKNGMNFVFSEVLMKIKDDCAIMGNLQRAFDKIIDGYKAENETQSKKIDISSVESENEEDNQKENHSVFNDQDLLRRRKKRVFKELIRTKSDVENRTPIKEKILIARYTPKTQKTEDYQKPLDSKSPHKRTPIFKKIKKPIKRPLERTIYYGQTKKFVPKKSSNPEYYLQKMLTSSSLLNESSMTLNYVDAGRKTQKKPTKFDMSDTQVNGFCIPQTPRPNVERKSNLVKKTQSLDFFKINTQGLKN